MILKTFVVTLFNLISIKIYFIRSRPLTLRQVQVLNNFKCVVFKCEVDTKTLEKFVAGDICGVELCVRSKYFPH